MSINRVTLGVSLVNLSQLFDAATSVIFLYINPNGGCKSAGIAVSVIGFVGEKSHPGVS